MNVLWADDQPDVVRTLRPLLDPLNAKIRDVRDGEAAVEALVAGDYDIAIVDLAMPPGSWGGLWLLEQLRDRRLSTPVLILSGEGSQTQTIQAMRLGARDYVRKEEVERELAERVASLVTADQQGGLDELLRVGPTPIAVALKRYEAAAAPLAQLKRLIELYEAVLRLAGILSLAEMKHALTTPPPADQLSIRPLQAPAMGTWHQVVSVLAPLLPEASFGARTAKTLERKTVARLIQVRNDIAHRGEPADPVAHELLEEFEAQALPTLNRLRRFSVDINVPTGLNWDGSSFDVSVVDVSGESVALTASSRPAASAPITGHAYLVRAEDGTPAWIDLHPLLVAEPSRTPGAWELFLFDGFGRRNRPPEDSDALHYLNVWSGGRVAPSTVAAAADLRGIAADWS